MFADFAKNRWGHLNTVFALGAEILTNQSLKVQIPGELLGKVIKVLISNKRQPNKNYYVINLVYISGEMVYQWYEIWGSWPQQFKY